jgi:hypothetical protein
MQEKELEIAFGPVGALGLVLLVFAVLRRSLPLAMLGGAALWADVTFPGLRGFAAGQSC